MAHDSDSFNRWEAGNRLAVGILLRAVASLQAGRAPEVPQAFGAAFARVLEGSASDPAFAAEALSLPSETYLAEQMAVTDPDAIHSARNWLRRHLAQLLRDALERTYGANQTPGPYVPDAAPAGKRALANLCLSYLMELDDAKPRALCLAQIERSSNMTEALAALSILANCDCAERAPALNAFYERWQDEPLVVDKWLAVQAASRLPSTLAEVRRLTGHRAFDMRNPNKVYALVRGFCSNQVRFHAADGLGYAFAAEKIIELDPINPQVAARIARAFDRWRKFDAARQAHARAALTSIQAASGLSRDVSEIVGRALA
jgi:aminopeptidase N